MILGLGADIYCVDILFLGFCFLLNFRRVCWLFIAWRKYFVVLIVMDIRVF